MNLGLMCRLYACNSPRRIFPPLDPRPGHLIFNRDAVHPDYFSSQWDLEMSTRSQEDLEYFRSLLHSEELLCPADTSVGTPPDGDDNVQWHFDHSSYWYLGYAAPDEASGLALVDAYRDAVTRGASLEKDLRGADGKTIYRLREDVQRSLGLELWEKVPPVLIERPGHHDKGAHVLYLPGFVWFVPLGEYPLTEKFIEALSSLDALRTG
jgi:hypothetical protein